MNAIIVFGYLIGTMIFGIYLSRYVKKDEDFFLAGRSLNQWVIAGTVMATNVAAIYLVGPAGGAYGGGGVSLLLIAWTGNMIAAASALIFVPRFRRLRITTVSEFLETRYGVGMRLLPAALWIFYFALFSGNAIYTLSVVLEPVLGVPVSVIILAAGGAVVIYTCFSGLIATSDSAVLQSFLMIVGGLVLLPLALKEVGGLGAFVDKVPEGYFTFWKSGEGWWSYKDIIMFTLLGLPYWCTSQVMMQRSFAGKSVRHASRGLILAALMTGPLTLSFIIPGICGSLLYPEGTLSTPDAILPTLLVDVLPIGLGGLIVAALVAASNSTASAMLNSTATLTEHDFYRRFVPKKPTAHYLWVGRVATLVGGLIGIAFALNVRGWFRDLLTANFTIMAFFEPPIFVVAAAALFWRRANAIGAACTVVCGMAFTLIAAFGFDVPLADRTIWAFGVCAVALVAGTYVGELIRPRTEEHKKRIGELAGRLRGIKPDFGSRIGVAGIAIAVVSLVAFVGCSFGEACLPKPGNVLIFMGLMTTFIIGCYMATSTFVPDQKEGLEAEAASVEASWTQRIIGSGWTWLGVYVFAIIMVIALYIFYEPGAASGVGPTLPVGPAAQ